MQRHTFTYSLCKKRIELNAEQSDITHSRIQVDMNKIYVHILFN